MHLLGSRVQREQKQEQTTTKHVKLGYLKVKEDKSGNVCSCMLASKAHFVKFG